MLLVGLGLLVAPLCVLYTDLERTTKLILRVLFYASPIIYSVGDLPGVFRELAAFNPLSGIFTLYRMGFFPESWDTLARRRRRADELRLPRPRHPGLPPSRASCAEGAVMADLAIEVRDLGVRFRRNRRGRRSFKDLFSGLVAPLQARRVLGAARCALRRAARRVDRRRRAQRSGQVDAAQARRRCAALGRGQRRRSTAESRR